MGRRILIAVLAVLLAASPAGAAGRKAYKGAGAFSNTVGLFKGLTFLAPLNDSANPLRLSAGSGLAVARTHDATHTATFVSPDNGYITVATTDQPRLESTGLLVESLRINLALRSNGFDNTTVWAGAGFTRAQENVLSPDGTLNAWTITSTSVNQTFWQQVTAFAVPSTFSIYLKRKTGTGTIWIYADTGHPVPIHTQINSSTWTRVQTFVTPVAGPTNVGFAFASSGDAVYAYGAAYEIADGSGANFASSYIPTTTTAMTRNEDTVTFPSAGNVSGTVGTILATLNCTTDENLLTYYLIRFNAAAGNTPLYWAASATSGFYDGTNIVAGPAWDGSKKSLASSWGGTSSYVSVGGTSTSVQSFDGDMSIDANAALGRPGNAANFPFCHFQRIMAWDRLLSNDERNAVTQ